MTQNPQVQSQILQILKFTDGYISSNPSFESNDCALSAGNLAAPNQVEAHYLTMTRIVNVKITDSLGRNNDAIGAYKKNVPGVSEQVIGARSMQIITTTDDTYTMRFIGNGQPSEIENIRGVTNKLADATYIVRYDDLVIPNGRVAEVKIVNDQV